MSGISGIRFNTNQVTYNPKPKTEGGLSIQKTVPVSTIKADINATKTGETSYAKYRGEGLSKENIIEILKKADPKAKVEEIGLKIDALETKYNAKISGLKSDLIGIPKPSQALTPPPKISSISSQSVVESSTIQTLKKVSEHQVLNLEKGNTSVTESSRSIVLKDSGSAFAPERLNAKSTLVIVGHGSPDGSSVGGLNPKQLAQRIKKEGITQLAVLDLKSCYSDGFKTALDGELKAAGIQVGETKTYSVEIAISRDTGKALQGSGLGQMKGHDGILGKLSEIQIMRIACECFVSPDIVNLHSESKLFVTEENKDKLAAAMLKNIESEINDKGSSDYDINCIAIDLKIPKEIVIKVKDNLLAKKELGNGIEAGDMSVLANETLNIVSSKIKKTESYIPSARLLLEDKGKDEMAFERNDYELEDVEGGGVCCHDYALSHPSAPKELDEFIRRAEDKTIAVCFLNGKVAHSAIFRKRSEDDKKPFIQSVPGGGSGRSPIFRTSIETLESKYKIVLIYDPKIKDSITQSDWNDAIRDSVTVVAQKESQTLSSSSSLHGGGAVGAVDGSGKTIESVTSST